MQLLIRGTSLFQAYLHYIKFSESGATGRPHFAIAKVIGFLLLADTLNFNYYYMRTQPILKAHTVLLTELEAIELEEHGHPDDIYLIKH